MSTGKRLAKRSILGSRVCAPTESGLYFPGIIQATKTDADDQENVYCVLFEDKSTKEYRGSKLIGPGFQTITTVKLIKGQKVYVTHNGREVSGVVVCHKPEIDEVFLTVEPSAQNHHVTRPLELKKRLEEVRLMESRKSARLQEIDTDYSRLAEGQTEITSRRRTLSLNIDVPSGRKRRPSADDADTMDDCMAAAMVLMSLSCSPKSPRGIPESGSSHSWTSVGSWDSGRSTTRTGTPSPPTALSSGTESDQSSNETPHGLNGPSSRRSITPVHDEGIEVDECIEFMPEDYLTTKKKEPSKVVFLCTWPGCGQQYQLCEEVEKHVRAQHLGKRDSKDTALSDHEEEFYYTEVEASVPTDSPLPSPVALQESDVFTSNLHSYSAPTLSHLDMVRPPHEDPEYQLQMQAKYVTAVCTPAATPINIPHQTSQWQPHAYAASAPSSVVTPQKCMRLSPKSLSSSPKNSPLHHRRGRLESRKCRKVYGMENRDLWCTQCKWKKACSRFVD